jgi:hypothetical protein
LIFDGITVAKLKKTMIGFIFGPAPPEYRFCFAETFAANPFPWQNDVKVVSGGRLFGMLDDFRVGRSRARVKGKNIFTGGPADCADAIF